jgi:hypothetical protein
MLIVNRDFMEAVALSASVNQLIEVDYLECLPWLIDKKPQA